MLDLSKPLGIYEGITFYGDHQEQGLVYYLPDEVQLARIMGSFNQREYELNFQIFKEGTAVIGDSGALDQHVGAILSLGVECRVGEERLQKAARRLAASMRLEADKLRFAVPPWKEGKVDLFVLDASTQNGSQNGFVNAIIGSRTPSLLGGHLKSIFNVKLDRRGAAMVLASLEGNRNQHHVAGVWYELKFEVLQPALDLKIRANLSRCQQKVGHIFSAKVGYPPYVGVGADLEFIKSRLEEDGDIEVEVLSQATDPQTRQLMQQTVDSFKNKIIDKLFEPTILPANLLTSMVSMLGNNISGGGGNIVQLGYKFKHEEVFHDRFIEVDYRERSASIWSHYPQAHIWALGKDLKLADYVQVVNFSDLWRENTLRVNLLHDFADPDADLLSAEVLVWRKKDGINPAAPAGRFCMPERALPLASFTFTRFDTNTRAISWIAEADEPIGYIYQVRLAYERHKDAIDTPAEILSDCMFSSSQDLIVIPQVLAPTRLLEVKAGGSISFSDIQGIDITLRARNGKGENMGAEVFSLNEQEREVRWQVRRPPLEKVFIEEERLFHFRDGRPSLKNPPREFLEEELIIHHPFESSWVRIIPVVVGASADRIQELLLEVNYNAGQAAYNYRQLFRSNEPPFLLNEVVVSTLNEEDKVHWKASAVTTDGRILELDQGEAKGTAPLLIDLREKNSRFLTINWLGEDPDSANLKSLVLEFRLLADNKIELLKEVTFSGKKVPQPQTYSYPLQGNLEMRIVRRYKNGVKEKESFERITGKEIIIKP